MPRCSYSVAPRYRDPPRARKWPEGAPTPQPEIGLEGGDTLRWLPQTRLSLGSVSPLTTVPPQKFTPLLEGQIETLM